MTQEQDNVVGLVTSLVEQIVDNPDAVEVDAAEDERGVLYIEVSVDADDIGQVIGRQGRLIKAIRTLARAAASQSGIRVEVELAE